MTPHSPPRGTLSSQFCSHGASKIGWAKRALPWHPLGGIQPSARKHVSERPKATRSRDPTPAPAADERDAGFVILPSGRNRCLSLRLEPALPLGLPLRLPAVGSRAHTALGDAKAPLAAGKMPYPRTLQSPIIID